MSPKRPGPRPRIDRFELLEAIDWCGIRWPLLFSTYEVTCVNEALDREILEGTVLNAYALSPRGRDILAQLDDGRPRGRLEVHDELRCREHAECLTVVCVRCDDVHLAHVTGSELEDVVRTLIADHECPGRDRRVRDAGLEAVSATH